MAPLNGKTKSGLAWTKKANTKQMQNCLMSNILTLSLWSFVGLNDRVYMSLTIMITSWKADIKSDRFSWKFCNGGEAGVLAAHLCLQSRLSSQCRTPLKLKAPSDQMSVTCVLVWFVKHWEIWFEWCCAVKYYFIFSQRWNHINWRFTRLLVKIGSYQPNEWKMCNIQNLNHPVFNILIILLFYSVYT